MIEEENKASEQEQNPGCVAIIKDPLLDIPFYVSTQPQSNDSSTDPCVKGHV